MKSNKSKLMFAVSLIAGWTFIALPALGQTQVVNPLDSQNNPKPLAVVEALQPYQDHCQISINGSFGTCNFQPVPTGKRLIIEEFDSFGYMATGVRPVMLDLEAGSGGSVFFPVTAMGTSNGLDFFATHNATRIYSYNSTPGCVLNLSGTAYSVDYLCHFSGFLVDVPY